MAQVQAERKVAEGKIGFDLVSPERLVLSEDVDMVVVPGEDGYFGVLPGHAPIISTLRPGVIDIYRGGTISSRVFVAGGFADVTPRRLTVLAEGAAPLAELTREGVEREIRAARDVMEGAHSDHEMAVAKGKLAIAEMKLAALG